MTRKDYIAVAAAMQRNVAPIAGKDATRDAIHADYCRALADVFAADNPAFDRARFLAACGVQA